MRKEDTTSGHPDEDKRLTIGLKAWRSLAISRDHHQVWRRREGDVLGTLFRYNLWRDSVQKWTNRWGDGRLKTRVEKSGQNCDRKAKFEDEQNMICLPKCHAGQNREATETLFQNGDRGLLSEGMIMT